MKSIALLFVLLVGGVAFADAGAVAANPWAMWFPLIAMACGSVGALVRRSSPAAGFWHTVPGHLVLVLVGALLGSLGPMFEAGVVTRTTLISALVGGGVAFLSALKPNGVGDAAKAAVVLLALSLSVSACTPEFKSCQLGALPKTVQTLVADVLGILYNPSSVVADLEALPNQPEVQCIVQAWRAYEAGKAPAPAPAAIAGGARWRHGIAATTSVEIQSHAAGVAAGYLAKHGATSCAGRVSL